MASGFRFPATRHEAQSVVEEALAERDSEVPWEMANVQRRAALACTRQSLMPRKLERDTDEEFGLILFAVCEAGHEVLVAPTRETHLRRDMDD